MMCEEIGRQRTVAKRWLPPFAFIFLKAFDLSLVLPRDNKGDTFTIDFWFICQKRDDFLEHCLCGGDLGHVGGIY